MEGALFLDVVIAESTAIFQLLTSEDQTLLIWGNAFLILDLSLHVFDGVRWLNLECDGLAGEGLDEDLHTTSQTKHKMEGALFLDVVIAESTAIFQLLTSEDQTLLIWGNAFLILDLSLHVFDGVRWLNLECDGLAGEGLDKDLHTTSQTKHKMEGALFLDVVIAESTAIFQLLTSEDQTLLIWGNAFLILDLSLHVFDGVRWLNLECDGLAGEGLDEDLHTTSQTKHKMEGALFLDVVIVRVRPSSNCLPAKIKRC